jgi:NAD(P)-dependent dehydrogenase (short-subunit alcohol dehydrogenase family)
MRLKTKTALITGGNSGIGLATARLFIAEGARVAITGRNQTTLDAAAAKLGPSALAFNADVLDSKARDVLFATIKEKFGHLDIVFANAGIGGPGSIEETSEAIIGRSSENQCNWHVPDHPGSASSVAGGRIHHFEWFDRPICWHSKRCRVLCC